MQQCLCAAAVFVSARNLSASLPAITGIALTHHRDFRQGIHPSGLLVPSICLLGLHRAPLDAKPYVAHFSGSVRIDDASHFTPLPFQTSLRNIHSAAMERLIEEHRAQLESFALETTLWPVTSDQARRAKETAVEWKCSSLQHAALNCTSIRSKSAATAAYKALRRLPCARFATMQRETSSLLFRRISEAPSKR